jgi:hypothetical protein
MHFESKNILFLLLVVLVPIVLHFLFTRRALVRPFDAIFFLVLEHEKTRFRLKWSRILLLFFRVLIVLFAVLLFAKPYVEVEGQAAHVEVSDLAIVLDDSLSMALKGDSRTLFEIAKERAEGILSSLPPDVSVFVVLASKPVRVFPEKGAGWAKASASRFISKLEPTWGRASLGQALEVARGVIKGTHGKKKQIVVISDFLTHSLDDLVEVPNTAGIEVIAEDVFQEGADFSNIGVLDAKISQISQTPSYSAVLTVTLANTGKNDSEPLVTAMMGLYSETKKVSCKAHERCGAEFLLPLEQGAETGMVKISEDALNLDNLRFFHTQSYQSNLVVLVDGAPNRFEPMDEVFFLKRALMLEGEKTGHFDVRVIRPEHLSSLSIANASAVALLNIDFHSLSLEQKQVLENHLSQGGAVFVSLGDNMEPDEKPFFSDLRLKDLVASSWSRIDKVSQEHMVTKSFADIRTNAVVRKVGVLETRHETNVLIRLVGGLPLLSEVVFSAGGKMVVLHTSVDADWNDLPFSPFYAPLMRSLFKYMGGDKGFGAKKELLVGDRKQFDCEKCDDISIVAPDGKTYRYEGKRGFSSTTVPGAYVAKRASGEVVERFVVNFDPEEDTFERPKHIPFMSLSNTASQKETKKVKKSLVPYLLLVLLLLLGIEAYLGKEF